MTEDWENKQYCAVLDGSSSFILPPASAAAASSSAQLAVSADVCFGDCKCNAAHPHSVALFSFAPLPPSIASLVASSASAPSAAAAAASSSSASGMIQNC